MGLRSAGSSFGITTEFRYRFYETPLPTYASTYVRLESAEDIDRLSTLSKSGDVKLQFAKAFHTGPVSTKLSIWQQVVASWKKYAQLCIHRYAPWFYSDPILGT